MQAVVGNSADYGNSVSTKLLLEYARITLERHRKRGDPMRWKRTGPHTRITRRDGTLNPLRAQLVCESFAALPNLVGPRGDHRKSGNFANRALWIEIKIERRR